MILPDAIALLDHPALRSHLAKSAAPGQAPSPFHWADLGCGSGLFTLALAHFLAPGSTIDAIDLHPTIPHQTTSNCVTIRPRTADFIKDDLPVTDLDGVLMANSLHYVRDKPAFLSHIKHAPALLLIEYDTDRPVPRWVPYPLSFASASTLFATAGRPHIVKLSTHPSAFGRADLYAALAVAF